MSKDSWWYVKTMLSLLSLPSDNLSYYHIILDVCGYLLYTFLPTHTIPTSFMTNTCHQHVPYVGNITCFSWTLVLREVFSFICMAMNPGCYDAIINLLATS